MLSNRCAAVLSIANTDNKHGRFDSTKLSEGFSFRKFGAIEPLRCCVIHGGSKAPNFLKGFLSNCCAAVLSISNTDNKHGRFDSTNFSGGFSFINLVLSNRCAVVLSIANTDNKHGRFDSTKFSERVSFRKFGAIEPLRCCGIHCEY